MNFIAKLLVSLLIVSSSFAQYSVDYGLGMTGNSQGLISRSKDVHTVYFKVANEEWIDTASLSLDYNFSSMLQEGSFLKVNINDIPVATKTLFHGANGFSFNKEAQQISIHKSLIKNGVVKLSIETNSVLHGDPCIVGESAYGLIHILPSSKLTINYKRVPTKISSYIDSLPEVVKLKINQQFKLEDVYDVISSLNETGRRAVYVTDITRADILIGNAKENEEIIQEQLTKKENYHFKSLNKAAEVRVYQELSLLILNTDIQSDARIYSIFKNRAVINQQSINNFKLTKEYKNYELLKRDTLGLTEQGTKTKNGQVWRFKINPTQIKGTNTPDRLYLSLTSSPTPTDAPNQLHVYQSGQLLKVVDLDNSGRPQSYSFNLFPYTKNQDIDMKIAVLFSDKSGMCSSEGAGQIATVLPDTHISFTTNNSKPRDLAQLAQKFNDKIKVYYPKNIKKYRLVRHIATIAKSYGLTADQVTFVSYVPGQTPQIDSSFILVTQKNTLGSIKTPLSSGSINTLVAEVNNEVLKLDNLKSLGVLQLASFQNFNGINLHFPSDITLNKIPYITFDNHDVHFIASNDILASFDSKMPNQHITVFANENILESFYTKYKYFIFFALWLLLTVAFIRLGRRK